MNKADVHRNPFKFVRTFFFWYLHESQTSWNYSAKYNEETLLKLVSEFTKKQTNHFLLLLRDFKRHYFFFFFLFHNAEDFFPLFSCSSAFCFVADIMYCSLNKIWRTICFPFFHFFFFFLFPYLENPIRIIAFILFGIDAEVWSVKSCRNKKKKYLRWNEQHDEWSLIDIFIKKFTHIDIHRYQRNGYWKPNSGWKDS